MNNQHPTSNNQKGFSLVETLVAVGILAVAVVGALTAAQSGISSSIFSKDQVVAIYLAQEGVEKIRSIRDENALNDEHWLTGISANVSDPCYFGNYCYVDALFSSTPVRCSGGEGSCPRLRQDSDTDFYGYDIIWDETQFRREILLRSINEKEISILVTVDWSKGSITRRLIVRENILNWQ